MKISSISNAKAESALACGLANDRLLQMPGVLNIEMAFFWHWIRALASRPFTEPSPEFQIRSI